MSASVGTLWASWEWSWAGPIGSLGCLSLRPVLGSILAMPAAEPAGLGMRGVSAGRPRRQRVPPRGPSLGGCCPKKLGIGVDNGVDGVQVGNWVVFFVFVFYIFFLFFNFCK